MCVLYILQQQKKQKLSSLIVVVAIVIGRRRGPIFIFAFVDSLIHSLAWWWCHDTFVPQGKVVDNVVLFRHGGKGHGLSANRLGQLKIPNFGQRNGVFTIIHQLIVYLHGVHVLRIEHVMAGHVGVGEYPLPIDRTPLTGMMMMMLMMIRLVDQIRRMNGFGIAVGVVVVALISSSSRVPRAQRGRPSQFAAAAVDTATHGQILQ